MADSPKFRPKVLLSAYACEPDQGSEPGVGWRWAGGLASRSALTVLTRKSNQRVIETHLDQLPPDHALHSVRFVYHDLGGFALALKRKGILSTFAYYVMWQRSVAKHYGNLADENDIVHHLTFCSLLCPGLWTLQRAKSVIGPVGAPLVSRFYLSVFGQGALVQRLRGWMMESFHRLPWLKRVLCQASVIVPANSETASLLKARGFSVVPVMLDTGSPETGSERPSNRGRSAKTRFLYAGRLERRKGLEIAFRALALAKSKQLEDWEFEIVGSGPDRSRLESLCSQLGLASQVKFTGSVTHSAVQEKMAEADVFFFTSVRDTSGGVNLEAMAQGLPVLCIAHQGVGDITDDTCAIRITPAELPTTIEELARGIETLCRDAELRCKLGTAAKNRAISAFRWEDKFDRMLNLYQQALGDSMPASTQSLTPPLSTPR